MAFVQVMSPCIACGQVFTYHPHLVPSIRLNPTTREYDPEGIREPICEPCVNRINPVRIKCGMQPIAYDARAYEGCEEHGL